jgi:hypothetical protein
MHYLDAPNGDARAAALCLFDSSSAALNGSLGCDASDGAEGAGAEPARRCASRKLLKGSDAGGAVGIAASTVGGDEASCAGAPAVLAGPAGGADRLVSPSVLAPRWTAAGLAASPVAGSLSSIQNQKPATAKATSTAPRTSSGFEARDRTGCCGNRGLDMNQ